MSSTENTLPADVEECAKSVKESNPEMGKSTAIAICQSMRNQGELEAAPDQDDIVATIEALGLEDDVPDDLLREHASAGVGIRLLSTHFDGPGDVRREEQDDDSIRYKNLLLIAPGEWTDAASEETLFYAPEAMNGLAEEADERVVDNAVNVNHEHRDQLLQVGHFDRDSLQTNDEGALFGDVVLWNDTRASQDAVALMDRALQTEGEQGAGGLSVEIPFEGEVTEWDDERGMDKMVEMNLAGLAIVTNAASEPAAFEEQFANRGIAMADGAEDVDVRVMEAGETTLSGERPGGDMPLDDEDYDAIAERVADHLSNDDPDDPDGAGEDLEDDPDEEDPEKELQDFDVAQDVISQATSEGFEPGEQTVADLIEFVQSNLDAGDEALQALEDAIDAHLQAEDADDPSAVSAEGLLAFVEEQAGDDDGDEEGGEEEADADGEEAEPEERENEQVEELQEQVETLERRLEELEDEPKEPRTLGEAGDPEGDPGGESLGAIPVRSGFFEDGDYFAR